MTLLWLIIPLAAALAAIAFTSNRRSRRGAPTPAELGLILGLDDQGATPTRLESDRPAA